MNEEHETDEALQAFMPAFAETEAALQKTLVPATLLNRDGHEIAKGRATVSNPDTLARFWGDAGIDLDALAGSAATLLLESGRSLPIQDAQVNSSTGTRFLHFHVSA